MKPVEFDEVIGPAHLASALINGDTSGLEDESELDHFMDYLGDYWVVSIKTDPDTGESEEPWFTWNFDLYGGTCRGGDVVTYIVQRRTA